MTNRFESQKRIALAGSERKPFKEAEMPKHASLASQSPAAQSVAEQAAETITVSVMVKPKSPMPEAQQATPTPRMSRGEFAQKHGANPQSVTLVEEFAKEFGLTVAQEPEAACTLKLSGSVAAMEKAFAVTLTSRSSAAGMVRVREGSILLPEELQEHVTAVLGLDNRPQAKPHFRVAVPHAANVSYTPVQVGELYGFPAGASAAGQTIGLIELGGGYREADITAYFASLDLAAPEVTAVAVDGGANTPGDANGADGEVMLDIEVAASIAQGAKIAVYFAPNTDQGFIDAVTMAVHDTTNKPSVISISWGGPESTWTAQALKALDAACQSAASVGVTITVAVGDDGSTDGVSGTANHVDFPASSPHVLACGGTKLVGKASTISSEVVWNELAANEGATGGGVSTVFAKPSWQANAKVPSGGAKGGRGVPDVAGNADPSTGYEVRVDGQTSVIGGTSAVAPLWAGLIALANSQGKSDAGFVNPALYATGAAKAFRDITQGNNGAYKAVPGWDACTGLGRPIGAAVMALVK